ncbi:MAG TPA: helix-hairpin-helix domain-containing protein, partial [Candidatus Atribacteria bacterium]|nr:helix-hairpin-helix domain-containing protein [Candidatus Atribacteria bacterium]
MAEITGLIEEIVFRNEDNGFSVVEIRDENTNSIVTAVGSFPFLSIGERVRLTGEWVRHPEYGRQLKMETYSTVAPSTLTGMENYLASGLIKGVGPSTARKLIEHFGLDVLDIIQLNPSRLTEVEGIGETRAALIASSFAEQREIREVMIFLQAYRIPTAMAVKIYKRYGSNTIGLIKQNPYRLAEDIEGIGFKTADAIAARLGIDPNSIDRAAAGTRYVLAQAASDGHTYLPKAELVDKAAKLLLVDRILIENALVQLAVNQSVVMEDTGDGVLVYLASLHRAEANTARLLSDL